MSNPDLDEISSLPTEEPEQESRWRRVVYGFLERRRAMNHEKNTPEYKEMKAKIEKMEAAMKASCKIWRKVDIDIAKDVHSKIKTVGEGLLSDPDYSVNNAYLDQNMRLNRYKSQIPFDHNRVVLDTKNGELTDYINASYIKIGDTTRYIAAQAPMHRTLPDWWKMIYDKNINVVVMLCMEIEKGQNKSSTYWPFDIMQYRKIGCHKIVMTEKRIYDQHDYVVRTLQVQKLNSPEPAHTVYQLQYRKWPDHSVPESIEQLLKVVHVAQSFYEVAGSTGQMLVHCSAGVGRTGTFIVIHHIREQLRLLQYKGIIVAELVSELRTQRAYMVNEKQFHFLYKCLVTMFSLWLEQKKFPELGPEEYELVIVPQKGHLREAYIEVEDGCLIDIVVKKKTMHYLTPLTLNDRFFLFRERICRLITHPFS